VADRARLRGESTYGKTAERKDFARGKRRQNDIAAVDEQVRDLTIQPDWCPVCESAGNFTHDGGWECVDCGTFWNTHGRNGERQDV